MKTLEKAIKFAIKAHEGQTRKLDLNLLAITHPCGVASILREYKMDDSVIAAGYLHDVVEDTDYTIEDIKNEFGEDIANLVESATEPNRLLSWEERKKETIDRVKNLPLRNKSLICADKIHNLESLYSNFYRKGEEDWTSFKRGRENQEWYFKSIYQSLIMNEDESYPMFKRLDLAIYNLFENNVSKSLVKRRKNNY